MAIKKKTRKKRRPYIRVENPRKLYRKMTQDHVDVLQNIEVVLVTAWREHPEIDDCLTAMALKAAIKQTAPMADLAQLVFDELEQMRQFRSDVSGEIWSAGLKVVLESVHTHSQIKPGERDYLSFASRFV